VKERKRKKKDVF